MTWLLGAALWFIIFLLMLILLTLRRMLELSSQRIEMSSEVAGAAMESIKKMMEQMDAEFTRIQKEMGQAFQPPSQN